MTCPFKAFQHVHPHTLPSQLWPEMSAPPAGPQGSIFSHLLKDIPPEILPPFFDIIRFCYCCCYFLLVFWVITISIQTHGHFTILKPKKEATKTTAKTKSLLFCDFALSSTYCRFSLQQNSLKQSCLSSVPNFYSCLFSVRLLSSPLSPDCSCLSYQGLPGYWIQWSVLSFLLNSEAVDTLISFFLLINCLLLSSRTPCSLFSFYFTGYSFSAALLFPPHLPDLWILECPGRSPSRDAFSVCIHCISDLMQFCGLNEQTDKKNSQICLIPSNISY